MLVDITLLVSKELLDKANSNGNISIPGHLGTHFDVMNKVFPLEYVERKGYFFDVSSVTDREIEVSDIDLSKVDKDMFIGFYTGAIEKYGYSNREYHTSQPVLSEKLIDELLGKKISIIGIDFPGVRKGVEHTPKDQYCADKNVFIIENLCNLKGVVNKEVTVNTYPVNYAGMSGLPCRVIVKCDEKE